MVPSRRPSLTLGNNVLSLNGLRGDLTLTPGAGLKIVPAGQTLTFSIATGVFARLTGDTITGNLEFVPQPGAYGLRIAVFNTAPRGAAGALYFDSGREALRVHNGNGWQDALAISGVTSVTTGAGLTGGPITTTGVLALDFTMNATWTGNHTFSNTVNFATSQLFPATKFYAPGQQMGDLLVFHDDTNTWQRLGAGPQGWVLRMSGATPAWGKLHLERAVVGTLAALHGGTGIAIYEVGDLLYADNETTLMQRAIGQTGQVLTVVAGVPDWADSSGVQGHGTVGRIPFWTGDSALADSIMSQTNASRLTLTAANAQLAFANPGNVFSGLATNTAGAVLAMGVNTASVGQRLNLQDGASLRLDTQPAHEALLALTYTPANSGNEQVVFAIDRAGVIQIGSVPVERLIGPLPGGSGGTGITGYLRGDLLYAAATTRLTRLPAENMEGRHLVVEDGVPAWAQPAAVHYLDLGSRLVLPPEAANEADPTYQLPLPCHIFRGAPVSGTWAFRWIEFRAETAPSGGSASVNVLLAGVPILSQDLEIAVGEHGASSIEFSLPNGDSGDLLQLQFGELHNSNFWSVHLLIEGV